MHKTLAVFDFDNTIIDDNSDTAVINLLDKNNIPHEIKTLQYSDGWTAFMQGVFTLLHERGVSADTVTEYVTKLPPVSGMPELIKELKNKGNFDIIIISDCNSLFIKSWLEDHKLDKCITKVFTNPSTVVNDMINISPYHQQDECKLSTKNLCKGKVLEDFVDEQKRRDTLYNKIIYIGDGANDFCPILRLKQDDLICVRNNFKLFELVTKAKKGVSFDNTGKPHTIQGDVFVWENGTEILNRIQT